MTDDRPEIGLLDTNVVILLPRLRDPAALPVRSRISAVTLAELSVGPLLARTDEERAQRQAALQQAEAEWDAVPFDSPAARAYGRIAAQLRAAGRKPTARAFDALIAATAVAHGLPLYTTDRDGYRGIADLDLRLVPHPDVADLASPAPPTEQAVAAAMPELQTATPALLIRLADWNPDADDDLPRRGFGFRPGMSERELADSTRAWWVLSVGRAANYRYAVSVHQGVTRAVWEIVPGSWRQATPETAARLGRSSKRYAFAVRPAPTHVQDEFVGSGGKRIPHGVFGSGSVIAYWG